MLVISNTQIWHTVLPAFVYLVLVWLNSPLAESECARWLRIPCCQDWDRSSRVNLNRSPESSHLKRKRKCCITITLHLQLINVFSHSHLEVKKMCVVQKFKKHIDDTNNTVVTTCIYQQAKSNTNKPKPFQYRLLRD